MSALKNSCPNLVQHTYVQSTWCMLKGQCFFNKIKQNMNNERKSDI